MDMANTVREAIREAIREHNDNTQKSILEKLAEIKTMLEHMQQAEELEVTHESDGSNEQSHVHGYQLQDFEELEVTHESDGSNEQSHVHGYQLQDFVGRGAYGDVYRAKHQTSGQFFATKIIKLEDKEITLPLAREISILLGIQHENIVRLQQVFIDGNSVYLIMEYIPQDLNCIIQCMEYDVEDNTNKKKWLRQLLSAAAYLHKRKIIHRDMKPGNILVDEHTNLKLADFGSARGWFADTILTPQVSTLLYRAPELLLGSVSYTTAVDLWSIGCIFAEIEDSKPLFGTFEYEEVNEVVMIHRIFELLGTPTEESWPGVSCFPNFPNPMPTYSAKPSKITPNLDAAGRHLLLELLCYDPTKRITAEDALKHPYLQGV